MWLVVVTCVGSFVAKCRGRISRRNSSFLLEAGSVHGSMVDQVQHLTSVRINVVGVTTERGRVDLGGSGGSSS